jgi:hypothetical protein
VRLQTVEEQQIRVDVASGGRGGGGGGRGFGGGRGRGGGTCLTSNSFDSNSFLNLKELK